MKNRNKIERLQVMLQSQMLQYNVKLQDLIEQFESISESEEIDRDKELQTAVEVELSDEEKESILDNIAEVEARVDNLLGIDSRRIDLENLMDINSQIADYQKSKLHADLFNEIVEELEEETTDKDIYVYNVVNREYKKIKYDTEHYSLLSNLNLIEKDGEIVYMKDFRIYDSVLHYIFDEDWETFILRKEGTDLYDLRRESYDFIPLNLVQTKKQLDEAKGILNDLDADEFGKVLEYMIEDKAQEIVDDLDEILGEGWDEEGWEYEDETWVDEMFEEEDWGDDWDE